MSTRSCGRFGAREGGPHRAQIEFERGRVGGFHGGVAPETLRPGVLLHEGHGRGGASGQFKVADRFGVHGEKPAGRAVFRGHVGDGGAVRQRQVVETIAVELHELPHHAVLAQHLHHAQYQVRGGDAFRERAVQAKADDFRNQHGDGLAEHRRFGFDPPDAPAEHP